MTATKFVNLTPHSVQICDAQGALLASIAPSGIEARIKVEKVQTGIFNEVVPVFETKVTGEPFCFRKEDGQTVPMPEMQEGTIYIVSGLFRSNYDRPDLYQPGELLRDGGGVVKGCIGLSR